MKQANDFSLKEIDFNCFTEDKDIYDINKNRNKNKSAILDHKVVGNENELDKNDSCTNET